MTVAVHPDWPAAVHYAAGVSLGLTEQMGWMSKGQAAPPWAAC